MGNLPDQQDSEQTSLPVAILYAGLRWMVAISVFAMMALTFTDVVGRYVFNRPLSGAYEVCGFLLGLVVFAGTSVVTKDRAHICVSLFNNLTGAVACARRILVAAWTGGSLALLAFLMWRQTFEAYEDGAIADNFSFPMAPLYFVIAVLATISVVIFITILPIELRPASRLQADADQ